jgi:uncharacterized membrane protein
MFPLFALFLGGVSVAALVVALRAQARADELGKRIAELEARTERPVAPSQAVSPESYQPTAQQAESPVFSSKVNRAPAQDVSPVSSPATAQQPGTGVFSSKVNEATDAPPVAFLPLPLSTAPADIHLSKQIQPESAPPFAPGAASPASTGAKKSPAVDWESFVGVKLFSWIAGIFLTIGAIYFLRYSIEQGWLSPEVRMVMGFALGVGLLVVCELKAARGYPVTANALDAAGIAILFATFFAGHALWHLIGTVAAFTLMALVTAIAVLLSVRRDSVFIALLGLIGGFATPSLLSTGEDHPVGLFGYLLLLNAGLAWVAYRKKWPFLSILSLVFTTFYQWGWVTKFLTEGKLDLAAGIFLAFPLISLGALSTLGRGEAGKSSLFGRTASVGAALPLLFALYLAAVPAYGAKTSGIAAAASPIFSSVCSSGSPSDARAPKISDANPVIANRRKIPIASDSWLAVRNLITQPHW